MWPSACWNSRFEFYLLYGNLRRRWPSWRRETRAPIRCLPTFSTWTTTSSLPEVSGPISPYLNSLWLWLFFFLETLEIQEKGVVKVPCKLVLQQVGILFVAKCWQYMRSDTLRIRKCAHKVGGRRWVRGVTEVSSRVVLSRSGRFPITRCGWNSCAAIFCWREQEEKDNTGWCRQSRGGRKSAFVTRWEVSSEIWLAEGCSVFFGSVSW